jgi:methionyl aminopeptidase
MRYKNLYTDMARTFAVGKISKEAQTLLDVTRESLEIGAQTIREGSTLREYASSVQKYVESFGYEGVRDLVGHGVGHEVHEAPQIPNYVDARIDDFTFKKGMVIALEPMVNVGTWRVNLSSDGWTFETADGALSAHFENTYVVTENGVEQLT